MRQYLSCMAVKVVSLLLNLKNSNPSPSSVCLHRETSIHHLKNPQTTPLLILLLGKLHLVSSTLNLKVGLISIIVGKCFSENG